MEVLKLISTLGKNKNLVLVCKNKKTENVTMELCKHSLKKFKKVCIVTSNRPYSDFLEYFKKNKIDVSRFRFIDCISANYMQKVPSPNCTYISSPRALTELSIELGRESIDADLVILDNVSSLSFYNGEVLTLRFLNSLTMKFRKIKTKSLFLITSGTNKETLANLGLFADKILAV